MFLESFRVSWDLVNGLQWHGCEFHLKGFCITLSGQQWFGLPDDMWPR